MTAHEKALNALNARLERLQANLREAKAESATQFLFQALVVTIAIGEALNDYIKTIGAYAQRRHGELKHTNETLTAQHADLLKSGKELLEQLKANPTDRAIRKEIERAQQSMAAIQKTVRRGANALQRDVAPGVAMIDKLSESVRRFSEAENSETLKRVLRTLIEQVRELYASHPALPARDIIDATAWEKAATSEIDQAKGFHDACARAGYQALRAAEWMTIAVSENPSRTTEEATSRVDQSVALRLKDVTARFTAA